MIRRAAIITAACACGCLGPRVSDEVPEDDDGIFPAGTAIPAADPALDARIAAADQVSGVVPRRSAFAAGAPAHAWDFGPSLDFAAPLFVLVRETAPDTYARIDHLPIAEAVPGDGGYSPYGSILYVEVTPAYAGELITSVYALQEAEADGLVEAPVVQGKGVYGPIVAEDVRLAVGGGAPPLAPAGRLYYDGEIVRYYDFGPFALAGAVHVGEAARYVLRREGGEPLSEPIRHVDLDGDGDLDDTNDVFAAGPGAAGYSPRTRTSTVAVPSSTASIDTSHDETVADLRDRAQLFDPDPIAGVVVAYDVTDEIRDLPQQRTAGGL